MTNASTSPRRRPGRAALRARAVAWMRVLAYASVATALVATFALRSVWASVRERSLVVGRELAALGDLLGEPSRVRLNGEVIWVGSTMTDASPSEVLDRFEAACTSTNAGFAAELEKTPAEIARALAKLPSRGSALGVMRADTARDGVVACLAHAGDDGYAAFARRARETLDSGDLSRVGDLRYVHAERRGARTHVVVAWTEGRFDVFHVVPMHGEEPPGEDAPDLPRPAGSRRLLDARVEGAPYGVRLYDAPCAESACLDAYAPLLEASGFRPSREAAGEVPHGRAFSRAGDDLFVFAYASGDRTVISLVESRAAR